jgi:hypothetical protein
MNSTDGEADLAGMPTAGLHVQLCGDAHLSNSGVFVSPERRLLFELNDFDETLPGGDTRVGAGLLGGDGRVRRDGHHGHLVGAPVRG